MDKLGDVDLTAEGRAPHVRTHLRLTLERMEFMMGEFVHKSLVPEIEGALKEVCDEVLDIKRWKYQIESQLRTGIEKMMNECIKAAIENNWEMRKQLTYMMGEEISKSFAEYIRQMKPDEG